MPECNSQQSLEACRQATRQYRQTGRTVSELHDPRNMSLLDRRGTPPYARLYSTKQLSLVLEAHRRRIAAETT